MNGVMEFTSIITPDGVEYPLDTSMRWLMTEEGFGMPDIEYITQRSPIQHGETVVRYNLKPRIFQLQIRNDSSNRYDYWSSRSELLNVLRPNRSDSPSVLRKKFSDGSIRDLDIRIERGPGFSPRDLRRWDEWGFTETLRFVAHDPLFYDPIVNNVTLSIVTDFALDELVLSTKFPINFGRSIVTKNQDITNSGSWDSFPTIVLTGPIDDFSLTNNSTNELIALEYDIPEGEVITIYLPFGNKRVVNSSNEEMNGIVSLDSNLDTFHLGCDPIVANGINHMTLLAKNLTDASSVVISFYTKFLGI